MRQSRDHRAQYCKMFPHLEFTVNLEHHFSEAGGPSSRRACKSTAIRICTGGGAGIDASISNSPQTPVWLQVLVEVGVRILIRTLGAGVWIRGGFS